MSQVTAPDRRDPLWRTLRERADDPRFRALLRREFPGVDPDRLEGVDRRRFLQLLGASMALATATGCRWEEERILSLNRRPEGLVPGATRSLSTAFRVDDEVYGIRVTTYDGRPIKVEGNPEHPLSLGATDARAQASILSLYDPDRRTGVMRPGTEGKAQASWRSFEQAFDQRLARNRVDGGRGLALLTEVSTSPTLARLERRFRAAFPAARWVAWSPTAGETAREGARLAFGRPVAARLDLTAARVVVALDGDLLHEGPEALRLARELTERRHPDGEMLRLYAVESRFTGTGMAADHRLPLRSRDVPAFLDLVERALDAREGRGGTHSERARRLATYRRAADVAEAIADDLLAARGAGVLTAGPTQPAAVHARLFALNARLGNLGRTVRLFEPVPTAGERGHDALAELAAALRAGEVQTLFVLGGNPVYDAPRELRLDEALRRAEVSVRLGAYDDETSAVCGWHLPRAHDLESWGDARAADGTVTVLQPAIEALHGGRSDVELVAYLVGERERDGASLVRHTALDLLGTAAFEERWRRGLHEGVLPLPARAPIGARPAAPPRNDDPAPEGLELTLYRCPKVHDGRFANNAWLQELPEFTTKLTWGNALLVAPRTAAELGLAQEDVVLVEHGDASTKATVHVAPGQARGSLALALGYGRVRAGVVGGSAAEGVEPVGDDATPLRRGPELLVAGGVRVTRTGARATLAATQEHHLIDAVGMEGREARLGDLVREGTLAEYLDHPDFAQHAVHHPPLESLWKEHEYDEGHRWGMAIDLGSCTGCNACVVACQAENNIPVVGKDEVRRGREMHWIRMDVYYAGEPDDPRATTQPVACQHCENAPCEQVCPVAATVHSSEGLNDMVYNRCIGTRYCANNCPYKVRRFNFFDYNAELEGEENELLRLGKNPEVTVRSRGVMEKCTFCVQRIQTTRAEARREGRELGRDEVRTACQQVCPTRAITFGDLNDSESLVARRHASPRSYELLGELNVKPRTAYLARVTNPSPALEAPAEHDDRHSHDG